jgi:hypothetical protein
MKLGRALRTYPSIGLNSLRKIIEHYNQRNANEGDSAIGFTCQQSL